MMWTLKLFRSRWGSSCACALNVLSWFSVCCLELVTFGRVFSCSFDFRITFLSSLPWHIKQILSTAVCSQRTTWFGIYYFTFMRGKMVPLTQKSLQTEMQCSRSNSKKCRVCKFILVAVEEMRAVVGWKKMTNLPLEIFRKENMSFLRRLLTFTAGRMMLTAG